MNAFNHRNSIIEVYQEFNESWIGFEHIKNGVKTRFEIHDVIKVRHKNKTISAEYMKSIFDTIGNQQNIGGKVPIKINQDANEYGYFAQLQGDQIGAVTLHDFITKRGINGLLQREFSSDNLFCFNPISGDFFQPMTMDVVVNNATVDNTDPENPITNSDGSLSITPVDGTPVVAKLYDGSVDYLTNLHGIQEAEITDMTNINFTSIKGKKRVFLFDANGNFSHKTFDV